MSKGKATRSSTATSSTPAPAPTISNDILTGRFTEADWNSLVEVEDGEEFVYDLVETIVGGVLNVIHERHVEENTVPFSLAWAEDVMVKLIDWQFLAHDTGEEDPSIDPSWLPDEEPARAPLDSWGRGSVPSKIVEVPEEVSQEEEEEEEETTKHHQPQESSGEESTEQEDLAHIRNNPDLFTLNRLREQLKYFKINEDDLLTLSKIDKPADTLHLLYQAMCTVQAESASAYVYEDAMSNLARTKDFIESFGPRPIEDHIMHDLKKYVDDIKLHPDHVTQHVTPAAAGLATWLHTAYTYQSLCNSLNVETTIDYKSLRCCIIEVKSLASPPVQVIDVMTAVSTLVWGKFGLKFIDAKYTFGDGGALLDKMEQFDCRTLSQGFIRKFKKLYMKYDTESLKRSSFACSYLYKWCEDQIYGSGSVIVRPPEPKPKRKSRRVVKVAKPQTPEHNNFEDTSSSHDNMLPHQSAAIVKAQQGRPPGQKEVEYDDQGNVISVMKIKKLPSHRVRTKYEIIEPETHSKRQFSRHLKPLKNASSLRSKESTRFPLDTQEHTPIPPSFVDAVQASPGVVIKQGSRVKRGPESVILSPIEPNSAHYHRLLSSNT